MATAKNKPTASKELKTFLKKCEIKRFNIVGVELPTRPQVYAQKLKLQEQIFENWQPDESLFDDLYLFQLLWSTSAINKEISEHLTKTFNDWVKFQADTLITFDTNPLDKMLSIQEIDYEDEEAHDLAMIMDGKVKDYSDISLPDLAKDGFIFVSPFKEKEVVKETFSEGKLPIS